MNLDPLLWNLPAFPASVFDNGASSVLGAHGLLVFESDRLELWGTATGHAVFDLTAVEPALVGWLVRDIIWTTHLMVHFQLLHKAIIGFT